MYDEQGKLVNSKSRLFLDAIIKRTAPGIDPLARGGECRTCKGINCSRSLKGRSHAFFEINNVITKDCIMQVISPKKILGVLGGMGPAASAEFMRLLTLKSPARKDQEHPIVYLLSDSQMPDRGAAIRGEIEELTPRLKADLEKLISWGADILATPCNTAHVFIDRFSDGLSVPYLHIVKETIASCRAKSPQ